MKRRGTVVLSVILALSLLCSVFGFTLAYAADEPENFATSQANWKDTSVGYATTTFDENGMKMTKEQAAAWWEENERYFKNRMVELGNEVLSAMIL